MRHSVLFYLNGKRHEISGSAVFTPLSSFLRENQRLCGTKVVCAEGACGACTVLIGAPAATASLRYKAMNSCLLALHQTHGCHVVTVEGVRRGDSLSPVQQALIAGHGAQCGFCTPGMVMTLTGVCEGRPEDSPAGSLSDALCGNLCRCTGYLPILESAARIDRAAYSPLRDLYPEAQMAAALFAARQEPTEIVAEGRRLLIPLTYEEAARQKQAFPEAVFVAGATELGVQWKKTGASPRVLISLAAIMASATVRLDGDSLVIDAGASWTQVEAETRARFPALAGLLRRFAGPQIKSAGTVGGQIAQNSPVGDFLPLLHVLNTRLTLVGPEGRREIGMGDLGTLGPEELIACVTLPLPSTDQRLRLEKVSRRAGFDRSIVSAALLLTLRSGTIAEAKLAYGGVRPRVCRLPRTEAFLAGKPLTEATLRAAGEILLSEIDPVDDARGSREYRTLLAANLLLRALDQELDEESA